MRGEKQPRNLEPLPETIVLAICASAWLNFAPKQLGEVGRVFVAGCRDLYFFVPSIPDARDESSPGCESASLRAGRFPAGRKRVDARSYPRIRSPRAPETGQRGKGEGLTSPEADDTRECGGVKDARRR